MIVKVKRVSGTEVEDVFEVENQSKAVQLKIEATDMPIKLLAMGYGETQYWNVDIEEFSGNFAIQWIERVEDREW